MAKTKSFFSRGRKVQTVSRIVSEQRAAGLIMHRAGSGDGAEWTVDGRTLKNFASCSYMGLERHPELQRGATRALDEYGSNFSISRIYLQCPLYNELEETLGEVMGRPTIVTPSTTVAHLAALPVLIGDKDVVLVDQFAHASIHMATDSVADVPIELMRHNRMDLLEERLKIVGEGVERVWYLCDGVYSMLGDYAPFRALEQLLRTYPKLHLYVDDAHAMSWLGRHGRGAALTFLRSLDRVVVAVSLSKAFGASGGALAFANEAQRDLVRACGGPLMFSGPMPPAALGAGLASAKLHLSPEFEAMQAELHDRVSCARGAAGAAGLELATDDPTPVLVLHYDNIPEAQRVVRGLRERGFFTCISAFPAVPMNKPSVRLTISRHNSYEHIRELVACLAELAGDRSAVLAGHGHQQARRSPLGTAT
ncbi:MAG TPA: aminotransferase class I/II-fold pyridoxal phosphate-dependent enzyme [Polyangia bacterium]|nr:aminotransferase class I/II-fold pyridoxal phosphate-dependent enzyme [Polyangia bacterium]